MIDGNELIEAVKIIEKELSDHNKAALKIVYEEEDKIELRAENTGHSVMMHEVIKLIKERM